MTTTIYDLTGTEDREFVAPAVKFSDGKADVSDEVLAILQPSFSSLGLSFKEPKPAADGPTELPQGKPAVAAPPQGKPAVAAPPPVKPKE